MEEFESTLSEEVSMISRSLYSKDRLLSWILDHDWSGSDFQQVEIVFDPENLYAGAVGIHCVLPDSPDELHEYVGRALRDGFGQIFMHIKLGGAK
jgi:hypothetical protein